MSTTKVQWLIDGKRQTDRFGNWVAVKADEISDHPTDQLFRLKAGVHYDLVLDAPADPSESIDIPIEEVEKAQEIATSPASDDGAQEVVTTPADPLPAQQDASDPRSDSKPKKRKGKRKIAKSKG